MSIAKSLRRSNNGRNIADNITAYIERMNQKKDQKDFNRFMSEAMSKMRSTLSGDQEPNFGDQQNVKSFSGTTAMNDLIPKSVVNNTVSKTQDPLYKVDQPKEQKAPTVRQMLTNDEKRMKGDLVLSDFMNKVSGLKNVDPDKLNMFLKSVELYKSGMTPREKKTELKSFDPKNDIYKVDDSGNIQLYKQGEKDFQQQTKTIGSYIGKDNYHYTKMIDNNGKIIEVKSENPVRPQKSNTIVIKPPKSEKWNDFGAYINSIDFKTDEFGNITKRNPQERKIALEVARNEAKSTLLPRALNWYQTEIVTKWGAENISQEDFETELEESYLNGELSQEESQDLLDYNQYRPFLFDVMRETSRKNQGEE